MPTLSAGIEYNPIAQDVGPIANWLAITEKEKWPALMFGTSSDRIGTPHGRAFYATVSKDLENWTQLPVSSYLGLSYGTFDDRLFVIGGAVVRWADRWSTTHLWDGRNVHHLIETYIGDRHSIGLVIVELGRRYDVGLTYSVRF